MDETLSGPAPSKKEDLLRNLVTDAETSLQLQKNKLWPQSEGPGNAAADVNAKNLQPGSSHSSKAKTPPLSSHVDKSTLRCAYMSVPFTVKEDSHHTAALILGLPQIFRLILHK